MRYFSYRFQMDKYMPIVTAHEPGTSLTDKERGHKYYNTTKLDESDERTPIAALMQRYPPPHLKPGELPPPPPRLDLEAKTWDGEAISVLVDDLRSGGNESEAELIEELLFMAKTNIEFGAE